MRIAIKRAIIDFSAVIVAIPIGWLLANAIFSNRIPVEIQEIYFVGKVAPESTAEKIVAIKQRYIAPGDTAVFRFVGEKFRNCPAIVTDKIADASGETILQDTRVGQLTAPGPFDTLFAVEIPKDAIEGFAVLTQRVSYGIDPLRRCFLTHVVGPPERPPVRFCIGKEPCRWGRAGR